MRSGGPRSSRSDSAPTKCSRCNQSWCWANCRRKGACTHERSNKPSRPSPWRDRTPEENLDLFRRMRCNEMILMEPEDIKPDYILVKHGKGSKERVVPKSPALSKQLMKYRTLRDGPLQKAFLKGCNGHFAQNRKKILVQCVRIMRIGGFFYTVPQGVQPYLGQRFKGQVSSIQVVKARLAGGSGLFILASGQRSGSPPSHTPSLPGPCAGAFPVRLPHRKGG